MARSRAKKVDDGPKISMKVENHRLVPISAFDQEMLDAWREGAIVNVSPVLAEIRPLEKRYWAMLTKLLKVAHTPWSNTKTAHQTLKEATGFIDPFQKEDGSWDHDERHLASFTDSELNEYFELFCGIVRKRFGIDPETLRKEAPDIGFHQSSEASSATAGTDDGPGVDPIPVDAGEPFSSAPPALVEDEPEADDVSVMSSSADGPLTNEDMAWLKTAARMLVAATAVGGGVSEVTILDRQWAAILRYNTARSVTPQARAIALRIHEYCDSAVVGGGPFERDWIANMAGCKVEDLRPEAR